MAYYNQAEGGGVVILPDKYEVNPDNYPQYRIKYARLSPSTFLTLKNVWMYPSDHWVVTHKIGPYYLIFSYEYNQRLCKADKRVMRKEIKNGEPCRDNESKTDVLIDRNGDVIGDGWVGIDDPKRVVWSGDRMVDLPLGKPADPIWGAQPSFEIINTSHASK
jgi:hypothetical protein